MSRVQVLMVTMNRKDFSLVNKLNIRCDAVIANQADTEAVWEMSTAEQKVKGSQLKHVVWEKTAMLL